jgi:hypothetical protein
MHYVWKVAKKVDFRYLYHTHAYTHRGNYGSDK